MLLRIIDGFPRPGPQQRFGGRQFGARRQRRTSLPASPGGCRTFAPIYRQLTVSAIAAAAVGTDLTAASAISYGDGAAAWRRYLATHNKGRPFVLIGHSQGSGMLQQLIRREIEGKPVARQMLRAIIPGFNLLVPQGRRVGGTFKSRRCAPRPTGPAADELGQLRENNVPPEGALFGVLAPGMTVGLHNRRGPADALGAARQLLKRARHRDARGPMVLSSAGTPPTQSPHRRVVSARCVNAGRALSRRRKKPTQRQAHRRIGGDVACSVSSCPAGHALATGDRQEPHATIES